MKKKIIFLFILIFFICNSFAFAATQTVNSYKITTLVNQAPAKLLQIRYNYNNRNALSYNTSITSSQAVNAFSNSNGLLEFSYQYILRYANDACYINSNNIACKEYYGLRQMKENGQTNTDAQSVPINNILYTNIYIYTNNNLSQVAYPADSSIRIPTMFITNANDSSINIYIPQDESAFGVFNVDYNFMFYIYKNGALEDVKTSYDVDNYIVGGEETENGTIYGGRAIILTGAQELYYLFKDCEFTSSDNITIRLAILKNDVETFYSTSPTLKLSAQEVEIEIPDQEPDEPDNPGTDEPDNPGTGGSNVDLSTIESGIENINETTQNIDNSITEIKDFFTEPFDEESGEADLDNTVSGIQTGIEEELEDNEIFSMLEFAEAGFIDLILNEPEDFVISWNKVTMEGVDMIPAGSINFTQLCEEHEILGTIKEYINIILSGVLAFSLVKYLYNLLLATLGVDNQYLYENETSSETVTVSQTIDNGNGAKIRKTTRYKGGHR